MYTYVLLNVCTMFAKYLPIQTSSSVILPTDLQTFQSYSCRIRHIHLYSFKEKVSNHIYSSITRHLFNRNSVYFPALRCFCICWFANISEENLLVLPLLSPSSLSTIEIRNVTSAIEIHLASFLYGIAHLHPSSSTIYPLSFLRLEGMLTTSTLAQIHYFKKLTTLDLILNGTNFPLAILSSLSKLPSLAKFKLVTVLYNRQLILDSKSSAKPIVYGFSNLENLEVRGNVNVVLRILQSIHGE